MHSVWRPDSLLDAVEYGIDIFDSSYPLHTYLITLATDVPQPLTNDLWVFLFQMVDAEYIK